MFRSSERLDQSHGSGRDFQKPAGSAVGSRVDPLKGDS